MASSTYPASPLRSSRLRLRELSYRGAILGSIAALLTLIAFGISDVHRAARLLEDVLRFGSKPAIPELLRPAVYGIAGLAAFFLLLGLHRLFDALLPGFRRTEPPPAPAEPSEPSEVESAEHFAGGAAPALCAAEPPVAVPAPGPLTPADMQRKALHAVALLAIESRSLRSAAPPRRLRRSSDYLGPRRRGTDNLSCPVYEGPYRRSSDSAPSFTEASPNARRPAPGPAAPNRIAESSVAASARPVAQPALESAAEPGIRT